MKAAGLLLFLLVAGPGFLIHGVRTLRRRAWHDGVPAIEYLIDRSLGVAPPPRTDTDRRFALFHTWMAVLFGGFFSLCLLGVLTSLFV